MKDARRVYDDAVSSFSGFRPQFHSVTTDELVAQKAQLDAAFDALRALTDDLAGEAANREPYEARPATWRR